MKNVARFYLLAEPMILMIDVGLVISHLDVPCHSVCRFPSDLGFGFIPVNRHQDLGK